jgi:uncharacterized protein (TIGR03435 family)
MRSVPVALAMIALVLTAEVATRQAGPSPSFDVASIKPNASIDGRGSLGPQPGGRWVMVNGTVLSIIFQAFNLSTDDAVVGEPDWVRTERYDVNAKAADPAVTFDQMRLMLQALLRERFALVARREMQEQPTYALTRANADGRLGPQFRRSSVDCDARRAAIAAGKLPQTGPPPRTGPVTPCTIRNRQDGLNSGGTTMPVLAVILTGYVGRIVIDKTGLAGDYEFDLDFAPIRGGNPLSDPAQPSAFPSIFTAVQEQLGLRLVSERNPVPVVVIESIHRPTPD